MAGKISIPERGSAVGSIGRDALSLRGGNPSVPDIQLAKPQGYGQAVKDAAAGFGGLGDVVDGIAAIFEGAEKIRQDGEMLSISTGLTTARQDAAASWKNPTNPDGSKNVNAAVGAGATQQWFASVQATSRESADAIRSSERYATLSPENKVAIDIKIASTMAAVRGEALNHMVTQANVAKSTAIAESIGAATQSVLTDPLDKSHQEVWRGHVDTKWEHEGGERGKNRESVRTSWGQITQTAIDNVLASGSATASSDAKDMLASMSSTGKGENEVFLDVDMKTDLLRKIALHDEGEAAEDTARQLHETYPTIQDEQEVADHLNDNGVPKNQRDLIVTEWRKRVDRDEASRVDRAEKDMDHRSNRAYQGTKTPAHLREKYTGAELEALDELYKAGEAQRRGEKFKTDPDVLRDFQLKRADELAAMTKEGFTGAYANTLNDVDYAAAARAVNAARTAAGRAAIAFQGRLVEAEDKQKTLNRKWFDKGINQIAKELGYPEGSKDAGFNTTFLNLQRSLRDQLEVEGGMSTSEYKDWIEGALTAFTATDGPDTTVRAVDLAPAIFTDANGEATGNNDEVQAVVAKVPPKAMGIYTKRFYERQARRGGPEGGERTIEQFDNFVSDFHNNLTHHMAIKKPYMMELRKSAIATLNKRGDAISTTNIMGLIRDYAMSRPLVLEKVMLNNGR